MSAEVSKGCRRENIVTRIDDLEDHGRRRRNQLEVIFAFQSFLHDLHMQHAEEAAAKSETQRGRRFWLEMQSRVVQAQLLQSLTKTLVIIGADWEQAGENTRLDLLESRQRLVAGLARQRQRITDRRAVNILDSRDDKTDLAGRELRPVFHLRRKTPTRSAL